MKRSCYFPENITKLIK